MMILHLNLVHRLLLLLTLLNHRIMLELVQILLPWRYISNLLLCILIFLHVVLFFSLFLFSNLFQYLENVVGKLSETIRKLSEHDLGNEDATNVSKTESVKVYSMCFMIKTFMIMFLFLSFNNFVSIILRTLTIML